MPRLARSSALVAALATSALILCGCSQPVQNIVAANASDSVTSSATPTPTPTATLASGVIDPRGYYVNSFTSTNTAGYTIKVDLRHIIDSVKVDASAALPGYEDFTIVERDSLKVTNVTKGHDLPIDSADQARLVLWGGWKNKSALCKAASQAQVPGKVGSYRKFPGTCAMAFSNLDLPTSLAAGRSTVYDPHRGEAAGVDAGLAGLKDTVDAKVIEAAIRKPDFYFVEFHATGIGFKQVCSPSKFATGLQFDFIWMSTKHCTIERVYTPTVS